VSDTVTKCRVHGVLPGRKRLARLACAAVFAVALSPAAAADHEHCPHEAGWVPQDLERILEAHRVWMINLGYIKLGDDEPWPETEPGPAVLCRADLRGADLSGAYLVEADFREADLSGANLSGANMIASTLIDASLVEANLNGVNLFKADLHGADLTRASLKDAHLLETVLTDAKLDDADLTDATGLAK